MIKHIVFDCDGTLLDTSKNPYKLFPGIYDLVKSLYEADYNLYIWTGRDRNSLVRILNDQKIISFVQDFKTINDPNPKPETAGLKEMLQNAKPQEVVVIGDSTVDMAGAKRFGAHSIGALWCPSAKKEDLLEFHAQFLASSPKDCYDLILKFNE